MGYDSDQQKVDELHTDALTRAPAGKLMPNRFLSAFPDYICPFERMHIHLNSLLLRHQIR